jgi:hypothetical protein
VIESIPGPDRAMMYVLAGWTGFRKGEIGSLTQRSFRFDTAPATATVAACYSKRKRQDTQLLHPEVVRLLSEWLATKPDLGPDDLLFPVSVRVPNGTERKTHKMMKLDLQSARAKWIEEGKSPEEQERPTKSDFLSYESEDGLFADFHSNRHMFITSLERAGLSPKMAQTLARHSDVRLTLGIYTHVGLNDQTAAIKSLPAPPSSSVGPQDEAVALRATGTDGPMALMTNPSDTDQHEVPVLVPSGAENGGIRPASKTLRIAPDCTEGRGDCDENSERRIVVTPDNPKTLRTERGQSASRCTAGNGGKKRVSPTGFEPVTFGFGGRRQFWHIVNRGLELRRRRDVAVLPVVPTNLPRFALNVS